MVKMLVVDDSNLMVAVVKNFIQKENKDHEVITGKTGEEAVELYKEHKPGLVFLDIKMPGMDGLTAMEKILEFDGNAKVVMVTALKEPEQEKRARDAGAAGYITKPFSSAQIIEAIKNNLS